MARPGKGDWAAVRSQLALLGSRAMSQHASRRLYPENDVGMSAVFRSNLVLVEMHDYCLRDCQAAESGCPSSYLWRMAHDS